MTKRGSTSSSSKKSSKRLRKPLIPEIEPQEPEEEVEEEDELEDLPRLVDEEDSDSEDENPTVPAGRDSPTPARAANLSVVRRQGVIPSQQGRQSVNPTDGREESTTNNISLINHVAHRLTREELAKVDSSRVALKSQNILHCYPFRNNWQGKAVDDLCTYLFMHPNPIWNLIGECRLLELEC